MEAATSANVDLAKFLTLHRSNAKVQWRCPEYAVKMLEEGAHADITLVVEGANGGSVKAHRCVLASVSPVFAAMFRHDMQEQLTSTVKILEMSIDALKLLLILLYTTSGVNGINIPELHVAIDEYFDELCKAFSKFDCLLGSQVHTLALARNLNPNNCWKLYCQALGDTKHITTTMCYNYVLGNYAEIIKSDSIFEAMKITPHQLGRVLRSAETPLFRERALETFVNHKKRLANLW